MLELLSSLQPLDITHIEHEVTTHLIIETLPVSLRLIRHSPHSECYTLLVLSKKPYSDAGKQPFTVSAALAVVGRDLVHPD